MLIIRLMLLAVLSLSVNNLRASIITLDFEGLLGTGTTFGLAESYGVTIIENGFQLSTTAGLGGFLSYLPTSPLYTDSIELIANQTIATTVLTQIDSSSFGINSIALGFSDLNQPGTAELTFFGLKIGGSSIQQIFTINNTVSNFNFLSSFNNLVSLTWSQHQGNDQNNHRFDNVNVDDEAIAIAEPPTLAVFVLGIVFLIYRRIKELYYSQRTF